jgi:hypothetical protein
VDEMGRTCSADREMRKAYQILIEKPEGKKPLGRSRRRWEDNIKMDLGKECWRVDLDSSGFG